MTLTIKLSPRKEERIKEQANKLGISSEEFINKLIDKITEVPSEEIVKLLSGQPSEKSPVNYDSLILQQKALGKIWDSPEEDLYDL